MQHLEDLDKLNIFILAGGFGTRLQEVVSTVPKPMAPIINKPFLDYQIDTIRNHFPKNTIYLLTHHKSEIIESHYKNIPNITIIKEKDPLGTGGSIAHAINLLNLKEGDSALILNGDTYIKPNLVNFVTSAKSDVSIVCSYQKDCSRYGTLTIENNFVIDFQEKIPHKKDSFINAGCYYFKNLNLFEQKKLKKFALEDTLKEYIHSYGKIDAFKYRGIFIDIGIPHDYQKMINFIQKETHE